MDLGVRQRLEGGQLKLGGQGVDAGVTEERSAGVIWVRDGCVALESAILVAAEAAGKVFVVIEVFEDRADGFGIVFWQLDASGL